jgi:N-acetyl-anhydromuramyl-L-alanine amidase AmpD
MDINKIDFEGYYIQEKTVKNQIVLHHTVSGGTSQDVVDYWINQNIKTGNRIATHFIIDKDGTINRLFDLEYWAGHIGDCSKSCKKLGLPNQNYSKNSIGIELVNFGALTLKKDKLYNAYGQLYHGNYISFTNPYRWANYFAAYTDNQIQALSELLPYLCDEFNIPKTYNHMMFDIDFHALNKVPGIYSHTSYRMDKSDVYPDSRLIEMLKNI